MEIIAQYRLMQFIEKSSDYEQHIKTWYWDVKNAEWSKSEDAKKLYSNVLIHEENRIIFTVKNYRLITIFNSVKKQLLILGVVSEEDIGSFLNKTSDKMKRSTRFYRIGLILNKPGLGSNSIKSIHTDLENKNAICQLEKVFLSPGKNKEADRLIAMITQYENKNCQIHDPDPVESFKIRIFLL